MAQTVIDDLKPEHKIFVCEIGAVHKGKIAQIAGIVRPKIGILTGINQQHLAVFGSQKNIIDAKYEILEALPPEGVAILNWNSAAVEKSYDEQKPRIKARTVISAAAIFTPIMSMLRLTSFRLLSMGRVRRSG